MNHELEVRERLTLIRNLYITHLIADPHFPLQVINCFRTYIPVVKVSGINSCCLICGKIASYLY